MNRRRKETAAISDLPTVVNPASEPARGSAVPPATNMAQLQGVRVSVSMELGRTEKTLNELLDIGEQSLIELDRQVGEPIDIHLNGQLFARGEVVTIGENFGVRITEILGQEREGK